MKSKILIVILVLSSFSLTAQTKKYLNLNLLGTVGVVGVSFDSRFSENSKFGYTVGLGYGLESHKSAHLYLTPVKAYYPEDGRVNNVVSAPMNVHYLIGNNKYLLELGIGLAPFYTDYSIGEGTQRFGCFTFGRIAYRYESDTKPWLFSIGLDLPFFTSGGRGFYFVDIAPSIAIGYRF